MRVMKKGRIVDIPIRQKTIVKLRENSGRVMNKRAIVMGVVPPSNFSRAYGKQVYVCTIRGDYGSISEKGANDLYPVGRAKRIPNVCRGMLKEYKQRRGR